MKITPGFRRSVVTMPVSSSRNFSKALALIAVSILLNGCGTMHILGLSSGVTGAAESGAKAVTEVYRGKYSFVRIEPSESGAAANQPMHVDTGRLRDALAALKGKKNSFSGIPLFTSKELDELVPPLAKALEKSRADADVVFAVTGAHGALGLLQSQSVTTGRAFITNGQLNVIFGLAQVNFEDELLGNHTLRPFIPGSRVRIINPDSQLEGASWKEAQPGRGDWQVIAMGNLLVHPGATSAKHPLIDAPVEKAGQPGASEIERRLEILERLKLRGLITEQEYRDKRRSILQDL